ncbi:uncharacterized protein Nmag_2615 [Natrialba magadii ATCC 43099]|uniref:Uncharacterized protein n=1 Tax=Natrialba magadii (strain ATCC 43099 / DSM 3394 / CCM 3739 / CIP 104546 / IAM 13178 / JCM 8861 / NBRC 102185 / NCIMB 2190 / MS3) TaxID=547559 RepID=D3SYY2_NATMM|nr:DUF5791 family protein [Natrialba magadii]ADD06174.1 uncharacterized protein Nmag_2615 [Natrialba magadii ATCC 43099]ELY30827.1 hypothetical protein C500_07313 [Natrialba magadii ATCC 43099]
MFYEQRMAVPDSPADLRAEYAADLAGVVDQHGASTIADDTELDAATLEDLDADTVADLSLEEAAQIQSQVDGEPDAGTIVEIACEHLLLGMTTAVLDVDAVESELAIEMDAKEIQQKIERRAPMSFEEYVQLQHTIVDSAR